MLDTSSDTLTPRPSAISLSPPQNAGSREIQALRPSTLIVCLAIDLGIACPLAGIVARLGRSDFAMPVAARSQPTPKAWPRMSGRQRPTLYPLTVAAEEPWTRRLGPGLFSFCSVNAGLANSSLCAGSDDPWAVTHVAGKRLPVGLGWPGGRCLHASCRTARLRTDERLSPGRLVEVVRGSFLCWGCDVTLVLL